jgi:glycerol-3-phosphate acyltransferase PlsY
VTITLLLLASYLMGSVPFAFIAARRLLGVDLRERGSGNVGATNLLRTTARARTAALVAGLDVAKGLVPVAAARALDVAPAVVAACAVLAIVGHIYPVWLAWRGGKGVATMCGAFLPLAPLDTLVAVAVFAGVLWTTRRVSAGSLLGTATLTGLMWARGWPVELAFAAPGATALVWWRHRANVRRLVAGTERRLGA